jgi:hypothetical protein
MSYQLFLTYANSAVEFLNAKLVIPTQILQNNLSLKTDSLPDNLKTPLNFSSMLLVAFFFVITYANNLICNLVGILYPLLYGLFVFNETPINTERSVTLNKYWMLFGVITLMDTFFSVLLDIIPGYFYLKVAAIYILIRNDFMLTNSAFSMLESYYAKSNIRPRIEETLKVLNTKLGSDESTKQNTMSTTNSDNAQ